MTELGLKDLPRAASVVAATARSLQERVRSKCHRQRIVWSPIGFENTAAGPDAMILKAKSHPICTGCWQPCEMVAHNPKYWDMKRTPPRLVA